MITILSVPRTGTRFWGDFIANVISLPVCYAHFSSENKAAIENLLNTTENTIVVPIRDDEETAASIGEDASELLADAILIRDHFAPRLKACGAHFMNTVKNESTPDQIRAFLRDENCRWTHSVTEFVRTWEPIGSRHDCNERSGEITLQMLKCKAFEKP